MYGRGNGRQDIFIDRASRVRFLRLLFVALRRGGHELHAWCQMTNHFHLLVRVGTAALGKMMKELQHRYAQYLHKRRGTDGHVFQDRYKDPRCRNDRHLLNVLRYIHRNPVKHGAVADPGDWEWSSHRAYLGRKSALVQTSYLLSMFGPGRDQVEAYRKFIGAKADSPWPHGRRQNRSRIAAASRKRERGWLPPLAGTIEAFAAEHGLSPDQLRGPSKTPRLSGLRRRFALDAIRDGYSISEVSRELSRSRQALHRLVNGPTGEC
ncbi:MAG: transposase [Elusimicrobia bacterium]|nr:transposase [Elusimicrobiota bacterium]